MNIGKKILAAFVEVNEDPETASDQVNKATDNQPVTVPEASVEKFRNYFEQLFQSANLPGPDYFEFSRMTAAMQVMPDEKSRYQAAFAGLQVQGLSKEKLLVNGW
jgi:hypothetical protein